MIFLYASLSFFVFILGAAFGIAAVFVVKHYVDEKFASAPAKTERKTGDDLTEREIEEIKRRQEDIQKLLSYEG